MPLFPVNKTRIDPYRNFLFRVKFDDGRYVLGVSKVSGLSKTVQVIKHREGGDPNTRQLPGQLEYGPITFERGVTQDREFAQWANTLWAYERSLSLVGDGAQPTSLPTFRRNLILELYNEGGQKVRAWNIYRAWVSEFRAIGDLDSSGNAVAIETITMQNEGWVQDYSFDPPKEEALPPLPPSFG